MLKRRRAWAATAREVATLAVQVQPAAPSRQVSSMLSSSPGKTGLRNRVDSTSASVSGPAPGGGAASALSRTHSITQTPGKIGKPG